MGTACCQDVQNSTSLMISQLPKRDHYFLSQWPQEDTFIKNYLDSYNNLAQFKGKPPMKHKQKDIYYIGKWGQQLPQGDGIIYIPQTLIYEGSFVDGKPQGKGKVIFIKLNCSYEGQIIKGQADGQGKFINDSDKYSFQGIWEFSKPKNGKLVFSENGTVITFLDYEKNNAKVEYADQKVYHGQLNNKTFVPDGVGQCQFPDGSKYNGQFLDGKMHGRGIFKWPSRPGKQPEVYDGQYQYNHKHGFGKFIFGSGNIYEGQWKQGKRHGEGIMIDKNGVQIEKGFWNEGKFMNES